AFPGLPDGLGRPSYASCPRRRAAGLLLLRLPLLDDVVDQADQQHVLVGEIAAAVDHPAALAPAEAIDAGNGRVALPGFVTRAEPPFLDELTRPAAEHEVPAAGQDATAAAAAEQLVAGQQLELAG